MRKKTSLNNILNAMADKETDRQHARRNHGAHLNVQMVTEYFSRAKNAKTNRVWKFYFGFAAQIFLRQNSVLVWIEGSLFARQ